MDKKEQYVVKIGDGYLLKVVNDIPETDPDPLLARRFDRRKAVLVVDILKGLGFDSEVKELDFRFSFKESEE